MMRILTLLIMLCTACADPCPYGVPTQTTQGCEGKADNSIDWDCILGPESEAEVKDFGGKYYACDDASPQTPCTTFNLKKRAKRAEVKINSNSDDFKMYKGEEWIIRYSFRPHEGMKVTDRFTHLGSLKPSIGDEMVGGEGLCTITATDKGLHVRFSNQGGRIEDDAIGMPLDWEEVVGNWVTVTITAVFGESMIIELSGAVSGIYVWPDHEKPIAWSVKDSDSVRVKLGLSHARGKVARGKVDYKDVSIVGPLSRPEMTAVSSSPGGDSFCF